jgi:uncharacterized protein
MSKPFVTDLARRTESWLFGHARVLLALLLAFTGLMAWQASGLQMSAGFEKTLPLDQPYIETFRAHKDTLFGANRLVVAVHARQGTIWRKDVLTQALRVTEALTLLPGVDRSSVTSLWTPNVFFTEITEEGFNALPITGGDVTPDKLDDAVIARIRSRVEAGGYIGLLVARDHTSALITADLREPAEGFDYLALNDLVEQRVRAPFENADIEIQVIGFAKAIGDISHEGARVLEFVGVAVLLTVLAVFWYCRSWPLTLLPILCSLTSLVWQFGALHLMGFGLDPLAVLVPFLVFAIGVSHGVQQINAIIGGVARGEPAPQAARGAFRTLFIPGSLALLTAFVSFLTLVLIPVPMIRELAITACVGVAFKVMTNLVMLPLAASIVPLPASYASRALARQAARAAFLDRLLGPVYSRRGATVTVLAGTVLFGAAVVASRDRAVGQVQPGVPELRENARFNRDARDIGSRFDMGLDWFTVVFEVAPGGATACTRPEAMLLIDDFATVMRSVPGVSATASVVDVLRATNAGMNEGQIKLAEVTRDRNGLGSELGGAAAQLRGIASADCRVQGVHLFLTDQKAETLHRVVSTVNNYRDANPMEGVNIRLASGNAGIQAAVDEVLERTELPMMLYVYAAIVVFVLFVYRDLRAVLACCLPLTVATWLGYAFMKFAGIGLTVATLPVMVLATGIGVDYAFYIYSRLQYHLARGEPMATAVRRTLSETGMATLFTALTLAIGVATWSFSPLKFQSDMGLLLTFMFVANVVMAVTLLPAFAIVLDVVWPRRGSLPVRALGAH